MYQINIHNTISQLVQIFYRFGVWRNEEEISVYRTMGWKLSYLLFFTSFVVSLILGGLLSDDKNEFVYLIAVGVTNIVVALKLGYIIWKKDEICAFVSYIGVHSIVDKEEFAKANGKVQKLMKFSFCFMLMIFVFCGGIIIFCLPVFTTEKRIPFNIWFPSDWKNDQISYWIAYAFVSTGSIFSAIIISLNVIIWYLMLNCSIKYEILGHQFSSIGITKPLVKKRKISEKEKQKIVFDQLITLINVHRKIQETIDRFKCCFSKVFFAQITTSGICICGAVYALSFANDRKNLLQFWTYVVLLLYDIFDIFMVMHFGNEIKLSSDRLSYCLFKSNWIEQSKSCKKCIIILTEVLKQPHELVIGILYPLSLETFTSILNLAYSMFNILQNLN